MKKLFFKYREIIMYLVFGVLTTFVGMGSYFLILFAARAVGVSENDAAYNGVRIVAQIIQWVLAVLFAYYTNKKWVFDAENDGNAERLVSFFVARLFSLGCDTAVTFGIVFLLSVLDYKTLLLPLPFGAELPLTKDFFGKIAAAIVVIIVNYVLSKFVVFKKER